MKRGLVISAGALAIAGAALATSGCHMNQSNFSIDFSLEKAVKQIGYAKMNCSSGGGGGGLSAGTGGVGFGGLQSTYHSSGTFSCALGDADTASFDQRQFQALLKAELEKELQASAATIRKSGESSSTGFFFEYEANGIRGRIEISGMRQGTYYTVSSAIEEKR